MGEFPETRKFLFRGGPMDGRELEIPDTDNREWWITTIDGVYAGDVDEISLESLEAPGIRRSERYLRVGDEFVHETLIRPEHDPPDHWS